MFRAAIVLIAALVLAVPTASWAQQQSAPANQDQFTAQDQAPPNAYQDQNDGQLLKLISYALSPIGFALEWGVTRPLHYMATESFLAPVFKGTGSTYFDQPPYKIHELPPPDKFPPDEAEAERSPTGNNSGSPAQATGKSAPAPSGGQPVLH